jgi:uncharacterized protein (DUF2225 family)
VDGDSEGCKGNNGKNKKIMLKLKIRGMLSGFYGIAMCPTCGFITIHSTYT